MAKSNQEFTQMYVPEFKLTQVADINLEKLTTITNSSIGVQILSQFIAQKGLTEQINVNEFVFILYLNKRNKVIAVTNLAIGGIDMTVMDVRLVFGLGLKCGASAMIVAHNHPTGNLQPSEADRQIARRIKEVGVLLQINALDFLIITSNNGYYSFADNSEYAHGGMMADGGNTFAKGGEVLKTFRHKHIPTMTYEVVDYTSNGYKGIQKDSKSLSAKERKEGKIAYYSKSEIKELFDEEFAKGGMMADGGEIEGVDLFEDYEDQPQEVQRILAKYEMEDNNYETLQNLKAELESIGYTMDFGLDAEPYDLRKIGQVGKSEFMAKGGITQHGLRVGDTIVSEIDANTIVVENPASGRRTINISTGNAMAKGGMSDKIVLLVKDKKGNVVLRTTSTNKASDYCGLHGRENFTVETLDGRRIMAKGGRMGFKALSEKVAKHYAGKSVPAKYQPEYGKFYDGDEAKTVGNKVAAKVYRLQQGK